MIGINTRTFPYRLDFKSKEPLEFYIKLTNGQNKRLLSIDIVIDEDISFNSVKPVNTDYKRIGEFGPGQVKELRYHIFPVAGTYPGTKKIKIRVGEHNNDYNVIDDKTETIVTIKVI